MHTSIQLQLQHETPTQPQHEPQHAAHAHDQYYEPAPAWGCTAHGGCEDGDAPRPAVPCPLWMRGDSHGPIEGCGGGPEKEEGGLLQASLVTFSTSHGLNNWFSNLKADNLTLQRVNQWRGLVHMMSQ
ncbi:hypothetical protein DXG01_003465, partial [Tephrocybe rancida]